MRQTISEKIISNHCSKRAKSGDIVIVDVDFCFGQDQSTEMIVDSFKYLGKDNIFSRDKFCIVFDHYSPSPDIAVSTTHAKIRDFARQIGVKVFDIGCGIAHQLIPEMGFITCGDLILGADTHTSTYGALNTFSLGAGSSDLALTLASGKNWLRVPETINVRVEGIPGKGVYSKDIMLYIISKIGAEGAVDCAIEFHGQVFQNMSMDSRFTVTSMAVETGAVTGVMEADKKTLEWMKRHSIKSPKQIKPDEDARYSNEIELDIEDLSPQVACPHSPNNVLPVEELTGTKVDQVVIGTCTNGRIEDFEVTAKILKGKRVAKGVKLIITPASNKVFLDLLKKGYIKIFIDAGAIVNNPGCGPCVGTHQGVLADGEVAFSTSNNNKQGTMANSNAEIYLGSPATAAATAIEGVISDPREHKRRL